VVLTVLAAGVAAQCVGRREDLVAKLPEPVQIRFRGGEFEDDGIVLARSQTFRLRRDDRQSVERPEPARFPARGWSRKLLAAAASNSRRTARKSG
jgi:hypothetical protein